MGISPSILPSSIARDIASQPRWPASLKNAQLDQLCRWYTNFRALGTVQAFPAQLAGALGLVEDQPFDIAEIWGTTAHDHINLWELLTVLAATSFRLSLRTKLAFFFRMWDVGKDGLLDRAEIAFLLRALCHSLSRYCRCESHQLPDKSVMWKYVERTFREKTSEESFVAWSMRHRLLRTTLLAFSSSSATVKDVLEFDLKGPPERKRRGYRIKQSATREVNLQGNVEIEEFVPNQKDWEDSADCLDNDEASSTKLPDISEAENPSDQVAPRIGTPRTLPSLPTKSAMKEHDLPRIPACVEKPPKNEPTNQPMSAVALGRLRILDVEASWADLKHQCLLHQESVDGEEPAGKMRCIQLTKHEVLLVNRLWHFFRENRDLHISSVRNILKLLQSQLSKQDSMVAKIEHKNIFRLTDLHYNRFFGEVVRRIRRGDNVSFHQFLRGVCPCASDARLRLFEHWQRHGHWFQEQAFTKTIKSWRKKCEGHWKLPVMEGNEVEHLCADMKNLDIDNDGVLSIKDLIAGALVTKEVAEELMKTHDINGDKVLNENEFLEMFCQEGMRSKSSKQFEALMRSKFKTALAQWQAGKIAPPVNVDLESATKDVFNELDGDDNGGISLDELVGYLDVDTAFNFMDAYDEDHDAHLSMQEFQYMVDPSQTTSGIPDMIANSNRRTAM